MGFESNQSVVVLGFRGIVCSGAVENLVPFSLCPSFVCLFVLSVVVEKLETRKI